MHTTKLTVHRVPHSRSQRNAAGGRIVVPYRDVRSGGVFFEAVPATTYRQARAMSDARNAAINRMTTDGRRVHVRAYELEA